jgi:hypothetical protein
MRLKASGKQTKSMQRYRGYLRQTFRLLKTDVSCLSYRTSRLNRKKSN